MLAWLMTVIVGIGESVVLVAIVVILLCRPNSDTDCCPVISWCVVQTLGHQRPRTRCPGSRLNRT